MYHFKINERPHFSSYLVFMKVSFFVQNIRILNLHLIANLLIEFIYIFLKRKIKKSPLVSNYNLI